MESKHNLTRDEELKKCIICGLWMHFVGVECDHCSKNCGEKCSKCEDEQRLKKCVKCSESRIENSLLCETCNAKQPDKTLWTLTYMHAQQRKMITTFTKTTISVSSVNPSAFNNDIVQQKFQDVIVQQQFEAAIFSNGFNGLFNRNNIIYWPFTMYSVAALEKMPKQFVGSEKKKNLLEILWRSSDDDLESK